MTGMALSLEGNDVAVASIEPGLPAAAAGIRPGDRIVQVEERALDRATFSAALERFRREGDLRLVVVRDGVPRSLRLLLRRCL